MKKIVLVVFLFVAALEMSAQTSQNNRTQVWTDNLTWGTTPPASDPITGTVNIYGKVSLTGNLSVANNGAGTLNAYDTLNVSGSATNNRVFNVIAGGIVTIDGNFTNSNSGAALNIYGTLIVKGNFTANSTVRVRPGGLLIIIGDFTMPNSGPGIINEGQTVVVGEVDIQGGSIQTGNQFYIFDDVPTFGSSNPSITGAFPTESSIPPPILTILEGLGVSCGGYNSISGSYVCSGSPSAVVTGSDITGASYTWERSTTSATTGFSVIGGVTTKNYSPGVITQTTWLRRRVTKSSPACTNVSATIQLMAFGSMWTGASNTDLSNLANWCGGIPTATTNVLIPSGLNKYPALGSLVANGLVIQSGASLNIGDNQTVTVNGNLNNEGAITTAWTNPTLNLSGNFTNTGTLTFNSSTAGTIRFQGSTQQTVTGGPYTFPNMTVNTGTNQVVFSSNVTVNGIFTLTSGIINMSGSVLTLGTATYSTGTLTYTAGRIANGTFTRYITNGAQTNFRFPMGTTVDNRSFLFTANITTGGTMSVTHVGATTTTPGLNITDGGTIQRRQDSYWNITTNGGLAGGPFNVFAGGTGFGTVGDLTNLRLMRTNATIASSTHVPASGSSTDFIVGRSGVSLAILSAGAVYIGSIDPVVTPLPIKLLSFNAYQQTDGILLKWVTSMEKNFDHFVLERAGSDLNFKTISTIPSKGGLDVTTAYEYLDSAPLTGKNYYRLKSVDYDLTSEYFNVIYANWDFESYKPEVSVYPNPIINNTFTLEVNREITSNTNVTLLNSMGTEVFQQYIQNNAEVIELRDNLRPGAYYLKITGSDFSKTIKVFIQ